MKLKTIKTKIKNKVGFVVLHRPEALNALNTEMMNEVVDTLKEYDNNDNIGCIVLTGSEKAFAAGADIKEMEKLDYNTATKINIFGKWEEIRKIKKPIVVGVSGYALGGGCELAMMGDIIIAAENAQFGQPEITLGVMPGMGGTQRLTQAIGKTKAMDMCLTAKTINAQEAEKYGLVARIVPQKDMEKNLLAVAETIAEFSKPATARIKETINRTDETNLSQGLSFEKKMFLALFNTSDQKEGMKAFIEKRKPKFNDK